MSYKYHYTFDAATLLERCLAELQDVLRTSTAVGTRTCLTLFDLKTALSTCEKLLLQHAQSLLEQERMYASPTLQELFVTGKTQTPSSLSSVVGFLRMVVEHRQIESLRRTDRNEHHLSSTIAVEQSSESYFYYDPNDRNSSDKLLFKLIVALQLCLVRLDDARFVLTGRRRRHNDIRRTTSPGYHQTKAITHHHHHHYTCVHTLVHACAYMGTLMYGTGFLASAQRLQVGHFWRIDHGNKSIWTAGSIGMAALTARWLRQTWNTWWMSSKIVDSTQALEEWNRKWHLVQAENNLIKQRHPQHQQQPSYLYPKETVKVEQDKTTTMTAPSKKTIGAVKSERVAQYALNSKPQTLWHSQGEVRFLVLKRAMDAVYASMDSSSTTATTNTSACFSKQLGLEQRNWRLQLAEAAFYSSIGARPRAMEIAASSRSARELLHNLWGMKSTPSLPSSSVDNHTLSQRALQLLNDGAAAVADRVDIGGISCFVLSRDPVPEMASAVQSFHHRHGRRSSTLRALSSIDEEEDEDRSAAAATTSRAAPRRNSRMPFEKRNVIFHLTGGGFFSHCIASDLPNLLHWSEVTGAVVICPEYGLLPEHTFPNALEHVEHVYKTLLLSNDDGGTSTNGSSPLGFEVNRLIVTGESAGGHLAVSLCTKLIMDSMDSMAPSSTSLGLDTTERDGRFQGAPECYPRGKELLPNALLCSCPLLDLSTTDSQTNLTQGGVVRAISDAYLPSSGELGVMDKKDPRVSPLFATNEVLRQFPPSLLLFAKQVNVDKDDDAVVLFHRRLQTAQRVEDNKHELRAVAPHHLPNNYLGLGMTGFPQRGHQQFNHVSTWLCSQFDDSNIATEEDD